VTAADLLTIQQEINGKNYRANAQAEDWVGKSIGQLLEITIPRVEKSSRQ
jgi:hypothetical protein